jgi:hypothetical protein
MIFQRVISVNLIGTFNMMRLSAAEMATLDPDCAKTHWVILIRAV